MKYLSARKVEGVSLLEMMLVLAIAAAVILGGMNTYRALKIDNDYLILKANVEFLFVAMKNFYQQECNIYFGRDGAVYSQGSLVFDSGNYAPVTFDVSKVAPYVSSSWPRYTPVVSGDSSSTAYYAQFNPDTAGVKNAYVCYSYTSGKPNCETPVPIPNSSIIVWQSQIAVLMKDPSKTTYYVAKVGADCAVNAVSTTKAVDCKTEGVALGSNATYMVWQRMPSFSSSNVMTSHWMRNPVTKMLKLQYTHDLMYELYNTNASPSEVYKYYLCGG